MLYCLEFSHYASCTVRCKMNSSKELFGTQVFTGLQRKGKKETSFSLVELLGNIVRKFLDTEPSFVRWLICD